MMVPDYMVPDAALMNAVETLDYRVTVGDVAAKAGLDIRYTEQRLLAIATAVGAHLQVSETGNILYLFPKNFRSILRSKSLRLRLYQLWQKVWSVLFYLIRISFGIILILSIVIMTIAIIALMLAANSQQKDGRSDRQVIMPPFLFRGVMFDLFRMDYYRHRSRRWQTHYPRTVEAKGRRHDENQMNFLEAVFSFLFGDGNPNADLGDRRWQCIAAVIRNNGGAVAAEQIAPYLDLATIQDDNEDYMMPVLVHFNGRPQVSPNGSIIYHFPALQVMAEKYGRQDVPAYLKEREWPFSLASATQLMWAGGLGAVNLVVACTLGLMLIGSRLTIPGLALAGYGVLLVYAIAFLLIPLFRYLWIRGTNQAIEQRNQARLQQASQLDQPSKPVQEKIEYAQTFASQTVVSEEDLAYTTEMDLAAQEALNPDRIDQEWQQRLKSH